ncbi:hypothetical protein MASR1M60_32350 [Rhodocyclaceae bacterium]
MCVAADRQRPFEVAAGGGIVRDIGTRFEVDAGRERTQVIVAEGMVEIDLRASDTLEEVGAGETAEYDGRTVSARRRAWPRWPGPKGNWCSTPRRWRTW